MVSVTKKTIRTNLKTFNQKQTCQRNDFMVCDFFITINDIFFDFLFDLKYNRQIMDTFNVFCLKRCFLSRTLKHFFSFEDVTYNLIIVHFCSKYLEILMDKTNRTLS